MLRISTLVIFVPLFLLASGVQSADAGGFLRRLCQRRTCPPACGPVQQSIVTVPRCCNTTMSVNAQSGTQESIVHASATTIGSSVATQQFARCLQQHVNSGDPRECLAQYHSDRDCCNRTYSGDGQRGLRALCLNAAHAKLAMCRTSNKIVLEQGLLLNCSDPVHYGCDPTSEDYEECYYNNSYSCWVEAVKTACRTANYVCGSLTNEDCDTFYCP